eukprot:1820555-Prymnesium_polylepis.1
MRPAHPFTPPVAWCGSGDGLVAIIDQGNGTYIGRYTLRHAGRYLLHVYRRRDSTRHVALVFVSAFVSSLLRRSHTRPLFFVSPCHCLRSPSRIRRSPPLPPSLNRSPL